MNPAKDGLPALAEYKGPTGEARLLFLGIEAATTRLSKGWGVPPKDIVYFLGLIQRVEGLKAALDHRIEMQGDNDD